MTHRHRIHTATAALALTVATAASSDVRFDYYEIFEVPIPNEYIGETVLGIGPDGAVLGSVRDRVNMYLGFAYNPNIGMRFFPHDSGAARDANADGVIVCTPYMGGSFTVWYSDGSKQYYETGSARAISNDGVVFGTAYWGDIMRGFVQFDDDLVWYLGHLGGFTSVAMDGNDRLNVCGYSTLVGGSVHAFLTNGFLMEDLGTLRHGDSSYAIALNNTNQVVCWSTSPLGHTMSFLYNGLERLPLGALQSGNWMRGSTYAQDINNLGEVVGYCETGAGRRAFLWRDGTMVDLNDLLFSDDSGWVLQEAIAINDNGDIAGHGTLNGEHRVFLLRKFDFHRL